VRRWGEECVLAIEATERRSQDSLAHPSRPHDQQSKKRNIHVNRVSLKWHARRERK
jgi:hypothetical protein